MIHPGRPSPDPDNTYAPMAIRPSELECGKLMHSGHLNPPCCLVGWLLHESRMEAPERLHDRSVPPRPEPIPPPARLNSEGRYVPSSEGHKLMVTDSGALGGPPWSSPMARRMDIRYWEGEWNVPDDDYRPLDKAITGLRRFCSSKHSDWSEHRGRPVCHALIRNIVVGRYTVAEAALRVEVTPERAEWLLHRWEGRSWQGAADKLWTWVGNDLNGIVTPRRGAA